MRSMEIFSPDLENLESNIATVCCLRVTVLSKDYGLGNSHHRAFLRRLLWEKREQPTCSCGYKIWMSTLTLLRPGNLLQMEKVGTRNIKWFSSSLNAMLSIELEQN